MPEFLQLLIHPPKLRPKLINLSRQAISIRLKGLDLCLNLISYETQEVEPTIRPLKPLQVFQSFTTLTQTIAFSRHTRLVKWLNVQFSFFIQHLLITLYETQ